MRRAAERVPSNAGQAGRCVGRVDVGSAIVSGAAWSRAEPRTRFSRAVITAITFTGFESTAVYRREAPVRLTGTGGRIVHRR
ncbi:hypothetical protein SCMC78_55150 [Streptomyces sp. CMC78]|uniref:Uncharacterized protein n=1 Tax=Streptomyces sp. CMC78 TaxID=3231512 RepID=A0AB33KKP5_9ACTN